MSGKACGNMQSAADYLVQILKDKRQLAAFPNVFIHVERLLDEEVQKIRNSLLQIHGMTKKSSVSPETDGPKTTLSEKVYIPVKEHPNFNFIGRIIGPRGLTAKQLELGTGCKIAVRGKGCMRDKQEEERNRGKPMWEHLDEELHVLITAEDFESRAKAKLETAVEIVKNLLVPAEMDELKKMQMVELAMINGNFKDSSAKAVTGLVHYNDCRRLSLVPAAAEMQGHFGSSHRSGEGILGMCPPIRPPNAPLRAPLIPPQPITVNNSSAAMLSGPPLLYSPPSSPQLSAADSAATGLLYTPYPMAADSANHATLASQLWAEYELVAAANHYAGGADKQWRHLRQFREHPYQRTETLSEVTISRVLSADVEPTLD